MTNRPRLSRLACVIAAAIAGPVRAADRAVHLHVPPPVRAGIAAMPHIADPADDAERRINAAVQKLDATVRKAALACKTADGKPGDWQRSIDVAMRGPGFISYTITDSTDCGGAYPSVGTMAIVYDLRSGVPVDWAHLLPATLTGSMRLQEGADGTRMITLSSPRLYALFKQFYRAGDTSADAKECRQALQDFGGDDPPAMMAWLDAKAGGLAVQFDLPHVVQACADPVVIPNAILQQEGAQPALTDAIAAAQR